MEPQVPMEGYFANSLEMDLAASLLVPPCNVVTSQQYYYEYANSTEYVFPSFTNTPQDFYGSCEAGSYNVAPSSYQTGASPSQYSTTLQATSTESSDFFSLESSVFPSPQPSASSSAAQSPQAELSHDALDLPLDDIFNNVDENFSEDLELMADQLLEVLKDVDCSDILSKLEFDNHINSESDSCLASSNSSVSSSPKRKYSSDSSSCYSVDSFETSSTESSQKRKRARHPKPTQEERAARKKDQNRKAAQAYRSKKKTEVQSSEQTVEELEAHRDRLAGELKQLHTEFNCILPLARAMFPNLIKTCWALQ